MVLEIYFFLWRDTKNLLQHADFRITYTSSKQKVCVMPVLQWIKNRFCKEFSRSPEEEFKDRVVAGETIKLPVQVEIEKQDAKVEEDYLLPPIGPYYWGQNALVTLWDFLPTIAKLEELEAERGKMMKDPAYINAVAKQNEGSTLIGHHTAISSRSPLETIIEKTYGGTGDDIWVGRFLFGELVEDPPPIVLSTFIGPAPLGFEVDTGWIEWNTPPKKKKKKKGKKKKK